MTEDDVKATVERIAQLERDFDSLADSQPEVATACLHKLSVYEKMLETHGYVLGDQGDDIIVYPLSSLKQVKEAWILYNRTTKTWQTASTTTLSV